MKTKLFSAVILLCLSAGWYGSLVYSQEYLEKQLKGYTNPKELVTMSSTLPFNQAVELLSKVSESTKGKKIISTVNLAEPIGLEIENMDYSKALVVITQLQGLMYEEKEDVIIIKRKNEPLPINHDEKTYASVDQREVKISAVLFQLNTNEAKQRGIDWKFLLAGKGLDAGSLLGNDPTIQTTGTGTGGTTTEKLPEYNITLSPEFNTGSFFGQATAVFKFFETENMGEILSSPNITVRDRQKARLQVGSDISIKQRDFAGNVVESFFSTGTIIEVTPYVYQEDGLNYILSDIKVEKSSFVPGQEVTTIDKTQAQTQVVMLNGEETVIGGLFINSETSVRNGVPFLKDLPWWFFGLRYIFGSDQKTTIKNELIILIKVDLVPTLKERLAWPQSTNPLQDELKNQREKIKYYQFNQSPTNEN